MFSTLTMIFNVLSDEDRNTVIADPTAYCAFVECDEQRALAGIYWLYCQSQIVAKTPLLTNPAFLLQLDAKIGKEWDAMNRGSIWQFAGVPRHADFNGQVRPVVEVNLSDLRQVIQRPTITWQ